MMMRNGGHSPLLRERACRSAGAAVSSAPASRPAPASPHVQTHYLHTDTHPRINKTSPPARRKWGAHPYESAKWTRGSMRAVLSSRVLRVSHTPAARRRRQSLTAGRHSEPVGRGRVARRARAARGGSTPPHVLGRTPLAVGEPV